MAKRQTSQPTTGNLSKAQTTAHQNAAALSPQEILPAPLDGLFGGAALKNPEQALQVAAITASLSRSPYPSAEMLREYREIGVMDQVLEHINAQALHRQSLEVLKTKGSERRQYLGQTGAFLVGLVGIALAVAGSIYGANTWVCAVVAVAAVGGPKAAPVLSRVLDRPPSKNELPPSGKKNRR
jgi:hypothetical protein